MVYGSLNLDYVYKVPHIVRVGETITSTGLDVFPGGKGLNQAIALAKAGAEVYLAGSIAGDGEMLIKTAEAAGVDCRYVRTLPGYSGQAIIQVDEAGQNSIVLSAGANRRNDSAYIDKVLSDFGTGDILLLQNEINLLPELVEKGHEKGLTVALNPSPFDEEILEYDLRLVRILLLNEIEGEGLSGYSAAEDIIRHLPKKFPECEIVLTLGKDGVAGLFNGEVHRQSIYEAPVVDTTAAGDTFTGYYLTARIKSVPIPAALRRAALASSITVSRTGASISIPTREEVDERTERI